MYYMYLCNTTPCHTNNKLLFIAFITCYHVTLKRFNLLPFKIALEAWVADTFSDVCNLPHFRVS